MLMRDISEYEDIKTELSVSYLPGRRYDVISESDLRHIYVSLYVMSKIAISS